MKRRCFIGSVLSVAAVPAFGQSVPAQSSSVFLPTSPWVYLERPISPQDSSRLMVRFSGLHESFQIVLSDTSGRMLGLGIGKDQEGKTTLMIARLLEGREQDVNGVERAVWSLSSRLRSGRFMETDKQLNDTLSALTGSIVAPRQMNGWSLCWSPGVHDDSLPSFVLDGNEWPQLGRAVLTMMEEDRMVQAIQSVEVDRLMREGIWEFQTRTLSGQSQGTLRILRM